MTSPIASLFARDRVSDPRSPEIALRAAIETLRVAVARMQSPRPGSGRVRPSLLPGGVVLATDDGRGIARAVAADLGALGHPVIRVRHGVGSAGVEGVNLTSSAAVAALLERARARGPLAAIVLASPLRDHDPKGEHSPTTSGDDARTFALLAQAGADDLRASAKIGGACLLVAVPPGGTVSGEDRFAKWVELTTRTLSAVRVRRFEADLSRDTEVLAADLVRAILDSPDLESKVGGKTGEANALSDRQPAEAILLGAPDRYSWLRLARALVAWLDESPEALLVDVAATLHEGQPNYSFRVGLVADSAAALALRLRDAIATISRGKVREIHDPMGIYWSDPEPSAARSQPGVDRVVPGDRLRSGSLESNGLRPALDGSVSPSSFLGRARLLHEVAIRFGRRQSARLDLLRDGRSANKLDFSKPLAGGPRVTPADGGGDWPSVPLVEAIRLLDEISSLQDQLVSALLDEEVDSLLLPLKP